MTPRQKRRLLAVGMTAAGLTLAATLTLTAFQQNLLFFLTPTQIHQSQAHPGQTFRLGGIVAPASLHRDGPHHPLPNHRPNPHHRHRNTPASSPTSSAKTKASSSSAVSQTPATASSPTKSSPKHDENYMPPEVKETLDKAAIERTLQQ